MGIRGSSKSLIENDVNKSETFREILGNAHFGNIHSNLNIQHF